MLEGKEKEKKRQGSVKRVNNREIAFLFQKHQDSRNNRFLDDWVHLLNTAPIKNIQQALKLLLHHKLDYTNKKYLLRRGI